MSGQYVVSDQADQDLLDIAFYLARYDVNVADRFIDNLHDEFQTIADFPHMGRSRDELRPGYRSFAVGKYIIFYRVIEDGISIMRVLHGSRDIASEFE